MGLAAEITAWGIFAGTLVAFLFLATANFLMFIFYILKIRHDSHFKYWAHSYRCTTIVVTLFSLLFNFKFIKAFYSRFFGFDAFCSPFEKADSIYRPLLSVTLFNILFSMIPIMLSDIVAFLYIDWGYQLLVCCIETFTLSCILIILTILEFRKIKQILLITDEDQYYRITPKLFDSSTVAGGA
jgi:hypothetical protein